MNVCVIGAGIFGIAAAVELRSRGHSVTVFEQGGVPNENASSYRCVQIDSLVVLWRQRDIY